MGSTTAIKWTDSTWSPWRGCTHATLPHGPEHEGCQNCYAEALAKRNPRVLGVWGANGTRVVNANWQVIRSWNQAAEKVQQRRFVFPSLCDPFEEYVGPMLRANGEVMLDLKTGEPWTMKDARREFQLLIDDTPWLTWILLTKRPQNVLEMWPTTADSDELYPRRNNVWLLTSVSDQATADAMIPDLLRCRNLVPVLGISAEPLLGPINLRQCRTDEGFQDVLFVGDEGGYEYVGSPRGFLQWVIIGGESGPHARPCNLEWIRSIVGQCRASSVPCFVKQIGSHAMVWDQFADRLGGVTGGGGDVRYGTQDRKGGDPAEWPEDLRVQEMPNQ